MESLKKSFLIKERSQTDVCKISLKDEHQPTSGDLTWTFSLQELKPFPTAFGDGNGMLL